MTDISLFLTDDKSASRLVILRKIEEADQIYCVNIAVWMAFLPCGHATARAFQAAMSCTYGFQMRPFWPLEWVRAIAKAKMRGAKHLSGGFMGGVVCADRADIDERAKGSARPTSCFMDETESLQGGFTASRRADPFVRRVAAGIVQCSLLYGVV